MSKLKELISEFCPHGVEFKKLGEVVNISKGVQFNKSNMKSAGSFPVINGGINPSGYIEKYNQGENTLTISQGGASAGYVNWISTKFWAGAHCYIIKTSDIVINRYVFHFLKSQEKNLQECQYGAGIPALSKATVENFKIPVPPLPVQAEIVRMLDTFTELISTLEEELTARKKQYEYYRDKLLTFGEVEYKTLGEIGKIKRGVRVVRSQLSEIGKYAVYQNSMKPLGYYDKFNCAANTTFVISAGAAGEIGYSYEDFWAADDCLYIECDKNLNSRFLYYLLLCQQKFIYKNVRRASVPRLSKEVIQNLKIPIPPIEEQERIVNILDKFDKLCNDLCEGIPAEIAARKKQYEYYRDLLLTFEEKN